MVKLAGLKVEEIVIPITGSGTPAVKAISPNALVPYLEHQGAKIWESLAIAEYCAEFQPSLWPADKLARAHARAIASEMHAGFRALRQAMPTVFCRSFPGLGQNPESLADIARIEQIFSQTRAAYGAGGPFLFGADFNAADAMFAPVCARLLIYQPPLTPTTRDYITAVRAHPLVAEWYDLAAQEPEAWKIEKYESLA